MPVGKREKVIDNVTTNDQAEQFSKIVEILNYAKFAVWLKNTGASYDLEYRILGTFDLMDPDAEWTEIKTWTTLGEGLIATFPTTETEKVEAEKPWHGIRIGIRRLSGELGDTTCDAFLNRKRH